METNARKLFRVDLAPGESICDDVSSPARFGQFSVRKSEITRKLILKYPELNLSHDQNFPLWSYGDPTSDPWPRQLLSVHPTIPKFRNHFCAKNYSCARIGTVPVPAMGKQKIRRVGTYNRYQNSSGYP